MSRAAQYRTELLPVDDGDLQVGIWEVAPGREATGTIMAIHGITASHRAWVKVAEALPGWRVVAPDLRGRGRSNALPGPYGLERHSEDLAAVARYFGPISRVMGHSMGAFAAVVYADRHPELVREPLLLIDGGVPLPVPPELAELTAGDLVQRTLGPAAERLTRSFPDRDSYRAVFRNHPALREHWDDDVADYVDYDLVGEPPELRSATVYEAMMQDSADLYDGGPISGSLSRLRLATPVLRAPRGLLDGEPLYPRGFLEEAARTWPELRPIDVPDVNHYTIIMSEAGASAVAEVVEQRLAD